MDLNSDKVRADCEALGFDHSNIVVSYGVQVLSRPNSPTLPLIGHEITENLTLLIIFFTHLLWR
jgi:hypothetical protein